MYRGIKHTCPLGVSLVVFCFFFSSFLLRFGLGEPAPSAVLCFVPGSASEAGGAPAFFVPDLVVAVILVGMRAGGTE